MESSSGLLIGPEFSELVERVIGDTLQCLRNIEIINLFVHNSDQSAEDEMAELDMVSPRLSTIALVLSHNYHAINELQKWTLKNDRHFAYFAKSPLNHRHKGAGIGVTYN